MHFSLRESFFFLWIYACFLIWSHSSLTVSAKQQLFLYLGSLKRYYCFFFNIETAMKLNEMHIVDSKICLMQAFNKHNFKYKTVAIDFHYRIKMIDSLALNFLSSLKNISLLRFFLNVCKGNICMFTNAWQLLCK